MSQFIAVMTIGLLGAISPGPDFFIVVKNAGLYHRKNGMMTALGISAALIIHQTYCILGLSWILTESPTLFRTIKILGALYLFYLGYGALRFKATPEFIAAEKAVPHKYPSLSTSFKQGFLCNVLNPKAALFLIGLYSLLIDPATPIWMRIAYGVSIISVTLIWFCSLTWMMNIPRIKKGFIRYQTIFVRLFGVIIIVFGVKVLFL